MSVRSLAGGSVAKLLPAMHKTQVRSLGWEERQWQPTPVFLLRKIHGQRSLSGYSPWGCNKLGMPECLSKHALSVTVYYIKCMKQAWLQLEFLSSTPWSASAQVADLGQIPLKFQWLFQIVVGDVIWEALTYIQPWFKSSKQNKPRSSLLFSRYLYSKMRHW